MNKLIKTFAAASLLTVSAGAMAATQGTSGATSSGSADITLTIANVIQITNMTDFTFNYTGAGSTLSVSDPICVYTNVTAGTFDVSATGSRTDDAADTSFTIDNNGASADTIAYTVDVNGTALTAGAAAVSVGGADTTSATCANTMSSLTIAMVEADVQAVPAGTYDGTVNITVAAQ